MTDRAGYLMSKAMLARVVVAAFEKASGRGIEAMCADTWRWQSANPGGLRIRRCG